MKNLRVLATALAVLSLSACVADDEVAGEDLDGDGKADSGNGVSADNLNGIWDTTISGNRVDDITIESWTAVGIRMHVADKVYQLTRSGDKLTADGVSLEVKPNQPGQRDDELVGKIEGKTAKLKRDVELKSQLTLDLPKDRPYRMFLDDMLTPMAQQDRESYIELDATKIKTFMKSTVLYQAGSFQRKYMKGSTNAERDANFLAMIDKLDGIETTPRSAITDPRFSSAIKDSLKDTSLTGLALVNFNLYFTTGAGRSIILPLAPDSFAYFITDRPARAEKLGLVVMDTPSHGPLASTFGRQLLDLGEMPANDNSTYAKSMMELLVKSDPRSVASLSGVGQSALTDWFAVMAIEDYRGTAFGNPELGWGYNITNTQFFGLVSRALARPTQTDSAGAKVLAQVIVGNELKPGDPSYADVLNSGNDLQEYPDMGKLKKLASDFLRSAHAAEVAEVEAAFADVVPTAELDSRAKSDIFHFVCAQLYDTDGRMKVLTGTKADRAVRAVVALFDKLDSDSAAFESYILSHGVTKSNEPAPKATGF